MLNNRMILEVEIKPEQLRAVHEERGNQRLIRNEKLIGLVDRVAKGRLRRQFHRVSLRVDATGYSHADLTSSQDRRSDSQSGWKWRDRGSNNGIAGACQSRMVGQIEPERIGFVGTFHFGLGRSHGNYLTDKYARPLRKAG